MVNNSKGDFIWRMFKINEKNFYINVKKLIFMVICFLCFCCNVIFIKSCYVGFINVVLIYFFYLLDNFVGYVLVLIGWLS